MGSTITEKILAKSAGKERVLPGDVIYIRPDMLVTHELAIERVYKLLQDVGAKKLYDPDKFALIIDHRIPAHNVAESERHKLSREFAREYGVKNFFDVGRGGVNHQVAVEKGLALPGTVYGVEDDAHGALPGATGCFATNWGMGMVEALVTGEMWCRVPASFEFRIDGEFRPGVGARDLLQKILADVGPGGALFGALEFTGSTVSSMSMGGRLTLTSNVVAAGAKSGIVNPDQVTVDYLKDRTTKPYQMITSDPDAEYVKSCRYEAAEIVPYVAKPGGAHNGVSVGEVEGIRVDQCAIGTCAGGRLEDLRAAAAVLKGRKIHPNTRMVVIPASQEVYLNALREGLIQIFAEAEAVVDTANCGFCGGAHQGVLASKEVCITTGPVNLPGRMGSRDAEIYLASAATVAATAVEGVIADPRRYV